MSGLPEAKRKGATPAEQTIIDLLYDIGENPTREGLLETPARVVKAWQHWMSGYNQLPEDVLKVFEDGVKDYDEVVVQCNIPFVSFCEHHLAPFTGVAHVGYLPDKKVVGLSKLARLVDIFARRLQLQEKMTMQICKALDEVLSPRAAGVIVKARHSCVESRGVQKLGTITATSYLTGHFRADPTAREEFFRIVAMSENSRII